jgi:hypothetical protein
MGDAGSNPALRCSLRTASRRYRRHDLNFLLPRRRPGPSGGTEGTAEARLHQRLSTGPRPSPGRGRKRERRKHHGECRSDYMCRGFESRLAERLVAQLDRAIDVRPTPGRRGQIKAGECRWDYIFGTSGRHVGNDAHALVSISPKLVASTNQSGECRVGLHLATMALTRGRLTYFSSPEPMTRWRMPVGLQVRAPALLWQEVGGPTPPPGNRIAQGNVSPNPGHQHQNNPANADGTTSGNGGSNPPRSDPETSRQNLVAGTEYAAVANAARDYMFIRRSPVRLRPGLVPVAQWESIGNVSPPPRRHGCDM